MTCVSPAGVNVTCTRLSVCCAMRHWCVNATTTQVDRTVSVAVKGSIPGAGNQPHTCLCPQALPTSVRTWTHHRHLYLYIWTKILKHNGNMLINLYNWTQHKHLDVPTPDQTWTLWKHLYVPELTTNTCIYKHTWTQHQHQDTTMVWRYGFSLLPFRASAS